MAGAARGCRGRGSAPQPGPPQSHSDMAGARDNCGCPTTDALDGEDAALYFPRLLSCCVIVFIM